MPLHRVFCDGNEMGADAEGGDYFWLGFPDSLRDIAAIGDELAEGLHVRLYSPGEFELDAYLKFDPERDSWIGYEIEGTFKYCPGALGPQSK